MIGTLPKILVPDPNLISLYQANIPCDFFDDFGDVTCYYDPELYVVAAYYIVYRFKLSGWSGTYSISTTGLIVISPYW